MVSVIMFVLLENFTSDWSWWTLILPVLLDLTIINKLQG